MSKVSDVIRKFVQGNPTASFREFKEQTHTKVSDAYYYYMRRKEQGPGTVGRKKKENVYIRIFSISSQDLSNQTKTVLGDFVQALNTSGKARMEVIEYVNSVEPTLEIRQVGIKI